MKKRYAFLAIAVTALPVSGLHAAASSFSTSVSASLKKEDSLYVRKCFAKASQPDGTLYFAQYKAPEHFITEEALENFSLETMDDCAYFLELTFVMERAATYSSPDRAVGEKIVLNSTNFPLLQRLLTSIKSSALKDYKELKATHALKLLLHRTIKTIHTANDTEIMDRIKAEGVAWRVRYPALSTIITPGFLGKAWPDEELDLATTYYIIYNSCRDDFLKTVGKDPAIYPRLSKNPPHPAAAAAGVRILNLLTLRGYSEDIILQLVNTKLEAH